MVLPIPLTTRHESRIRAEAVQLIVHDDRRQVRSLGFHQGVITEGAGYRQERGVMKEVRGMAEVEMVSSLL